MTRERNKATDAMIEDEVGKLVEESADGTYSTEELEDRVNERLTIADVASLKRDHIQRRISYRDDRQADLVRSTMQAGLPGEFAPPAGEFKLGEGRRVPKERARDDHWVIRLQLETDHISDAHAAHAATLKEYAAYQPYLRSGMDTGAAFAHYRSDQSSDRAAD